MKILPYALILSLAIFVFVTPLCAQDEKGEKKEEAIPLKEKFPPLPMQGTEHDAKDKIRKILLQIMEDMEDVSNLFNEIRLIEEEKNEKISLEESLQKSEDRQDRILKKIDEVIQLVLSNSNRSRGRRNRNRPSSGRQDQREGQERREREGNDQLNNAKKEGEKQGEKTPKEGPKKLPHSPLGSGQGGKAYGAWGNLQRKLMEEYRNLPRGVNLKKIPLEYLEKLNEYSKKLAGKKKK